MAQYYVSPTGNDTNPGTYLHPFRTVEKARNTIRAHHGKWTGDVYIWLRGGTYPLSRTLHFTDKDSGKDGYHVIYRAYTGERPIVSGGITIAGWKPYRHGIYRAPCHALEFRQLYVDGKKAIRARNTPVGTYNRLVAWDTSRQTIRIKATELENVQNLPNGKVEIVIQQYWAESIMRIESISAEGPYKDITAKTEERHIVFNRKWPLKSPEQAYHLENSLDFLDEEGEWFLDDLSYPHYVYYKPRPREDMASISIVAPTIDTLVRVAGANVENPAHHIAFEGITFEHANWTRPTHHGHVGLQSQQYSIAGGKCERPPAAFFITNAHHLRLTRNVFRHCGAVGLDLYTGTRQIVVEGNVLHSLSGSGMQIGKFSEADGSLSATYHPKDPREYCDAHIITNNYVHSCAADYYSGNGIAAGYVRNIQIIHNEIANLPYTGISVGWGWNFRPNVMTNNRIEYNKIHDVMTLLCDGGGIYTLGNQGPLSTIRYNYIYNTIRSLWASTPHTSTYPVASIYLDEGSSGFTVANNATVNSEEKWHTHFHRTKEHNTLLTNTISDSTIVAKAGIQPPFQAIRHIERDGLDTALFRFGILADVQYADRDDTGTRNYRGSLDKLNEAVHAFNARNVDFVIHLGDFINDGIMNFDTLISITDRLAMPFYHVLGNHDFPSSSRKEVLSLLGMERTYYAFVRQGWRFIVLDGNDISLYANRPGSRKYQLAQSALVELKATTAINAVNWNGAIGTKQLKWLARQLRKAQHNRERVVIANHFPIYPADMHQQWKATELLTVFQTFPSTIVYLNGHVHKSQYENRNGIPFITFAGMVEEGGNAFAIASVYSNRMEITGFGKEVSRVIQLEE